MIYQERQDQESLVGHLLRNAEALGLDRDQKARLVAAWRLMQGSRADRKEGERITVDVRDKLAAGLQAVVGAARARGEKVSTFNDAGAKRIKTRDGLAMLLESGGIDETQHKAGMAYRYCHEVAGAGLRSALGAAGQVRSGRLHGHLGRDAAELQRAYVIARLAQMERAVAAIARDARDGRELIVLRHVAGEGGTIRSITAGSRARAASVAALRRALDAVAKVLPPGGLRIRGH